MSQSDLLRIPRRGMLGRLLACGQGCSGIGGFFAKLQRVRRKRFLARLKSPQRQVQIDEVLQSASGREFQKALEKWLEQPARSGSECRIAAVEENPSLRCSVIINTVDRSQDLAITLDAMRAEWDASQDELIVVLGPGEDDSEEVVRRSPLPTRLLRCPQRNLAISRNIGLAAAAGRYVAFLDDDASPAEGWLEELLKPLVQEQDVAVSAGFVLNGNGSRFLNRHVVADTLGRAFWLDDESAAAAKLDELGRDRSFLTATGCNMAFRRSVLTALGGFDPAYAYFLEETDVVRRSIVAGFRCVACPASRVFHRLGANPARTPSLDLEKRIVVIRSQIHYIGKFGKSTFAAGEIKGCLWERVLTDLEKIAWDCGSSGLTAGRCGSLQNSYLQMVSTELRLDSAMD